MGFWDRALSSNRIELFGYVYTPIALPTSSRRSSATSCDSLFAEKPVRVERRAWLARTLRSPACTYTLQLLALVLLVAIVAVFNLFHHATSPIPAPVASGSSALAALASSSIPPARRLAELNEAYDSEKEGFGVGNANLAAYRNELNDAYATLFGPQVVPSAVDLVDSRHPSETPLPSIWNNNSCALDPSCALSTTPIPSDLYMTAYSVSPEPPSVPTWRENNPSLSIDLFNDSQVLDWINKRYPAGSIACEFAALPINILQFDLFRLLVLFGRGGFYADADTMAIKPVERWGENAVDLTDPVLRAASDVDASAPPALVIGVEWAGRTEVNALNPLYTRSVGVVQWSFGATRGHPVLLDSIRRIVDHTHCVVGDDEECTSAPLHFDPQESRMILEWSGPAVVSDAVARYLRTRWGVSLESVADYSVPVRIGDVVILPIGSLNARTNPLAKMFDWFVGRNKTPLTGREECLLHEHAASWWKWGAGGESVVLERQDVKCSA
ncbi:glycosyltransferase family 32 protein [Pseudohyphozyma bogoriensis]|nr:glycosyltransferase family 32 protein [Pseudohyphozyma bogoriensis]